MATNTTKQLISIVVPLYNESANLTILHDSLRAVLADLPDYEFEIVYVNDGSQDDSLSMLQAIAKHNDAIRIISLSRNFGKEVATTAGIHAAKGNAIITLDADGQHPVELISQFIERWQAGSKVVIGVRTSNQGEGFTKRYGSKIFYRVMNRLSGTHLVPGSSDFRLIDRVVQQEFMRMTERNRITRGLVDWLGYQRDYIDYVANPRVNGDAGYSFQRLVKLFIDSIISLSISPLYIAAYLGAFVLPVSVLLAVFMVVDKLFGDPFNLHLTGGAFVIVLMLFLIGVLLLSQGIIGLYLSHIHSETQNRPLYVIDQHNSKGLKDVA
jgi:glycosyltransferase involved in cell wall biosynthesis